MSLPSGLGAGGRGKEKAPCRYLHFEVDWDGGDGPGQYEQRQVVKKEPFRLEMGVGPNGLDAPTVSLVLWSCLFPTLRRTSVAFLVPSPMDQL